MQAIGERVTGTIPHRAGNPPPWLIVIAASSGGIQAMRVILAALPADLPAAIVLVQHRTPGHDRYLGEVLGYSTRWPIGLAGQGDPIASGHVYIARSDSHLSVTPDRSFLYRDGGRIQFVRSSANPLFASAAKVFGRHVIGVVLSGGGRDATDGVRDVKANGGIVIAQDELTSQVWGMPRAAIESGAVDYVLPVDAIAPTLAHLVRGEPAGQLRAAFA